jgi:iron complex transport system substrate-binding protein
MRRTLRLFTAWFLLGLAQGTPAAAEIRLHDDFEREIVLARPAQRIVSLAPNLTEVLFFLGAGERIVGADEYSNYPEQARAIPRVNNHAAANYELILALAPDLVLGWHSGNGEIPQRVRELGLAVFEVEPRRLEDIPGLFLALGQLTGTEPRAREQAGIFSTRLQALRAAAQDKAKVRVFYEIWHEPLVTLNGQHLVSDVIDACGGINIFADAAPLVPYVGIESVLVANPQVIIAGGSAESDRSALEVWSRWPSVDAVARGQVYSIPPDLMQRHSMRILEGASLLCGFLDQARR